MIGVRRKQNVYLAQVNYQYGNNVFIPYSVGMLQAYAQTDPVIKSSYDFQGTLFLRENPDQVASGMNKPSILALSCYMWNWEWNKLLARAVKTYYPDCLVIMGGIHVPEPPTGAILSAGLADSDGFFVEHPYVDVLIHGEGEFTFASVLLEHLSTKPDYTKIPGISIRIADNKTLKTSVPNRISDLSKLPSPYLTGIFDQLIKLPFSWNMSQETNRGCPYPCTFCAWGPAYQQKLYRFEEERILAEFEWSGRHNIEFIFNCDANWGIFERDYDLTLKLTEIKAHYGYPKKFRMCTAKNSNDRIFEITKVLDKEGMSKGATLSFQSMDVNVLKAVKRINMKINDFKLFMRKYREAGIATYTELIMGLPCETYETFKHGIDKLIDAGQHSGLNNYVCLMLPNDEMSYPSYIKKYGIRSVRMPILLAHSSPGSDLVQEYQDVVVTTGSMSEEDWRRIFVFSWAVQCFHCLGLTQSIAIFFRKKFNLSYSSFYEKIIDYFITNSQTLVGQQLNLTSEMVVDSIRGGRLDMILPRFGNIYWPLEEAAFLNLVTDKIKFYGEMSDFIRAMICDLELTVENNLVENLICYQSSLVIDPFTDALSVELQYDLPKYLNDIGNQETDVEQKKLKLNIKAGKSFYGDLETYAREVVWYSRKGGRFYHSNITVEIV
mgnify:CR=1 FL=1